MVGPLLKIGANDLNHVLRGFLCGFRILRHVVEDVVFHEFPHQAVDRATGGSETAENPGALLVAIQSLECRLELPDDFLGAIYQINFSREACDILLDYPTLVGYPITYPYPVGVGYMEHHQHTWK
jgi:hypothetical protein